MLLGRVSLIGLNRSVGERPYVGWEYADSAPRSSQQRPKAAAAIITPMATPSIDRRLFVVALALMAAACAPSSHVLVGTARASISPLDVKIYTQPPPSFEEVAILDASSKSIFQPGGQHAVDK